ncbi:PHP domain-containing protein [Geothermobacter hydrogeniphilus]|uniref:Phosphatase n=1 Tax=Geothermobacter hydrogeniphilus TaxID=1969733 RepID=A0A1X0XXK1_9BACT|nr:PHP domain-containing protein [Geothermobacter hydrogeniphilus]ORJ57582.1 phosphatase [Geothermobacter hydrogeniphilus]
MNQADKTVDLHLHSTCSDGLMTPEEVVMLAAERGVAAIALADHDNVDGIDAALAAGERLGVEVISGVELSVIWEDLQDVHLLGYGFDHHHPRLTASLAEFRDFRAGRNERIVERVNDRLVEQGRTPISFERVWQLAGGTFGRPHIARALLEAGHVKTMEEAFKNYLVSCNIQKRFFPVVEAIDLIHDAGGVAVLAHPPYIPGGRETFRRILDDLQPKGLDGVEVYNGGAGVEETFWYLTETRRRGLLVTGGSDDHGNGDSGQDAAGARLGSLNVPYDCLEELRRKLESAGCTCR